MNIKIIYLISVSVLFLSCNDKFLDRFPLAEISPENSFKTEQDLRLYTNSFYNDLPTWTLIQDDKKSDDILYSGVPIEQRSEQRVIPASEGSGGWSWGTLRKINIFFKYYNNSEDQKAKNKYSGVAYFFRALFYFDKIKRFGDVPWYDEVIGSKDELDLTKERDSRTLVISKIISDLDHAIENLDDKKSVDEVTKWTALALKSRVCLYEGTYRKYHSELDLSGADSLLEMSYLAAQKIMERNIYKIYSTGSISKDYMDLFASNEAIGDEVILARRYSKDLDVISNLNYYLVSETQDDISLTKEFVNSYLRTNGQPFTDVSGYNTLGFNEETENRDPRLEQTIRTPGYHRIGNTEKLLPNFSAAMTGYQIVKFLGEESQDGFEASDGDIPIFRYAEVLLNYAEAKAELGSLVQEDVDKSIKLLRERVGMPNLNVVDANNNPDPYLIDRYPDVSGSNKGIILEIRRERRIELVMEGFRWDDLMRWKAGKLLEKHFEGMYFPSLGEFDIDGDGEIDVVLYKKGESVNSNAPQKLEIGGAMDLSEKTSGNLIGFIDINKKFDEERDYLYPLPTGDILLNPNLEQNPNWSK